MDVRFRRRGGVAEKRGAGSGEDVGVYHSPHDNP